MEFVPLRCALNFDPRAMSVAYHVRLSADDYSCTCARAILDPTQNTPSTSPSDRKDPMSPKHPILRPPSEAMINAGMPTPS